MSRIWRDGGFVRALVLLLSAPALLHVVHVIAGHRWFSVYGPILAAALAFALVRSFRRGPSRPSLGLYSALVALFVVPEWLEGEVAAGHALDWTTLEHHGAATVVVVGIAAGAAMLWESGRLLSLIRSR